MAFETHLDGSAAFLDLRTEEVNLIHRSSFGDAALGDQEEVRNGDACHVHLLVQGLSGVISGRRCQRHPRWLLSPFCWRAGRRDGNWR